LNYARETNALAGFFASIMCIRAARCRGLTIARAGPADQERAVSRTSGMTIGATLANVRCRAHSGPKSDIAVGHRARSAQSGNEL